MEASTVTPRQFNKIMHTTRLDHEGLSINQTRPSLLSSSLQHAIHNDDTSNLKLVSPIDQAAPELPSWTPLKNDEVSIVSGSEIDEDELATRKAADLPLKRPASDTAQVVGAKDTQTVSTVQTLRLPSNANRSKTKRARFDGVFITTKPPLYRKSSAQTQRASASASRARTFSLVDALTRTFVANKHTEDPFPNQSHTASHSRDDIPTAPPTDAETTEAEDEQLQLNTRLAHPVVVKKRRREEAKLVTIKATASDTNSDNATSLAQDVPRFEYERLAKRFKPVQYEANPTLVDVALGTDQAPISWDAELDFIIREEDFVVQTQIGHVAAPADVQTVVDSANDHHLDRSLASVSVSVPIRVPVLDNDRRTATWGGTVLSPYQSRGAKFRQRLDAIFGEHTSVRTDRVARPRPADLDLIATLDQVERAQSPSPSISASTASGSPAPAFTAEEGVSAIPNTRITSQSPDVPPMDTATDPVSQTREQQQPQPQRYVADASTGSTSGTREEQMMGWIVALQRLVKGKVHVKEEHLEMLSIILAEIESLKGSLDGSHSMTLELRESIKQLSELHEIPFGDRNKLRQRAESIVHSWPTTKEKAAI